MTLTTRFSNGDVVYWYDKPDSYGKNKDDSPMLRKSTVIDIEFIDGKVYYTRAGNREKMWSRKCFASIEECCNKVREGLENNLIRLQKFAKDHTELPKDGVFNVLIDDEIIKDIK